MASLLTPVTDPALLQQLNSMQPADDATNAQLNQLNMQPGSPDYGSTFGGIVRGLRDIVDQGAALGANAVSSIAPNSEWAQSEKQKVAQVNKNAEQDYAQNWLQGQPAGPGAVAGRIAGNIAGTAPIAALVPGGASAALLPRIAAGAASGAASGALQPVDANDPNFWKDVGENALIGGAGGAAMPAAFGTAARIISPNTSADVQQMMQNGVRPTLGQMLGGTANRWEQGSTSWPLVGDFVLSGRKGAVDQFNVGGINQALAPIGEKLETTQLGRPALDEMNTKIDDAYAAIKPQLGWTTTSPAGPSLQANLASLRANAAMSMPKSNADAVNDALDRLVNLRMSSGGGMTGESFQEAKSDLGKMAVGLESNPQGDFWDKRQAGALWQAQQYMRDAQNLADPVAGARLTAVDNAWAHALRINNAANRLGGEPGVFSPPQLQASTKALDQSLRDKDFSNGDALMQNYAEAGKRVLGNTVPDSGTPFRSAMMLAGGALAPALLGHGIGGELGHVGMATALGLGGLGAASGIPYSGLGRAAIAHLLASRPGFAGPLANAIRATSPYGATAFAPLALGGAPAGQ